jgi:multidrug resistance efflux pump
MRKSAELEKGATPEANEPLTVSRVLMLQGLGLLVVLIAGGIIFYTWHQGYYNYSTDDALVGGTQATAASSAGGTVGTVSHQVGDVVQAGDTIATVKTSSGTIAVVSPIKGSIYNIAVTAGEYVSSGQALAQVVDLSSVYVTAYVDENAVRNVHIGQGVDVTVDGEYMHGTVRLIQPATASSTSALPTTDYASGNFTKVNQRVPVRINVYGGNGHLIYPGESANVNIQIHNSN